MPLRKSYAKKKRSPMRYYRRRRTGTKALVNLIKRTTLKQSEPKMATTLYSNHSGTGGNASNPGEIVLNHNVTHYVGELLSTTQSIHANPGMDVQDNRVGNEIFAKGIKIRTQFINAVRQSNVTFKYFVFWYNADKTNMSDADFWCGPDGAGAEMNRMLDYPDSREIKILKSGVIRTSPHTANMNQNYDNGGVNRLFEKMHSNYRDIWIPLNQKIVYDGNNSPQPKLRDIGMAIVAYDVNNTAQSQVLGYLDFTSRLYFRDP